MRGCRRGSSRRSWRTKNSNTTDTATTTTTTTTEDAVFEDSDCEQLDGNNQNNPSAGTHFFTRTITNVARILERNLMIHQMHDDDDDDYKAVQADINIICIITKATFLS